MSCLVWGGSLSLYSNHAIILVSSVDAIPCVSLRYGGQVMLLTYGMAGLTQGAVSAVPSSVYGDASLVKDLSCDLNIAYLSYLNSWARRPSWWISCVWERVLAMQSRPTFLDDDWTLFPAEFYGPHSRWETRPRKSDKTLHLSKSYLCRNVALLLNFIEIRCQELYRSEFAESSTAR